MNQHREKIRARVTTFLPMGAYKKEKTKGSENNQSQAIHQGGAENFRTSG